MKPGHWLALTLTGHLGLLAWVTVWLAFLSHPARMPVSLALLLAGTPLLLPLRGLLHGRVYTVKWSLFLALGYFAYGVVEGWAGERGPGLVMVLLSLAWFAGGIGYVRSSRPPPSA